MHEYHCYLWTGPRSGLEDHAARRNPATTLPPVRVGEWMAKPATMRERICTDVDAAAAWTAERLDDYAPRITPVSDRHDLGLRIHYMVEQLHQGFGAACHRCLADGEYLILAVVVTEHQPERTLP